MFTTFAMSDVLIVCRRMQREPSKWDEMPTERSIAAQRGRLNARANPEGMRRAEWNSFDEITWKEEKQ
jgi:hypothetical protein